MNQASWFNTGSPRFLLQVLKSKDPDFLINLALEKNELSMNDIKNSVNPEDLKQNVPLLLFQTGYLTFLYTKQNQEKYKLVFPNLDVKKSLPLLIAQAIFRKANKDEILLILRKLRNRDYKSYFNFIMLNFSSISPKLTVKEDRKKESVCHVRFSIINHILACTSKGVSVTDHEVQAAGNLEL